MLGSAIEHPFNGERVEKWTGEAQWTGICLVTYMTTKGKMRHLVEVEPQGFQMIAVTDQLRLAVTDERAEPVAWRWAHPNEGNWKYGPEHPGFPEDRPYLVDPLYL